jgi:hypothetical protein
MKRRSLRAFTVASILLSATLTTGCASSTSVTVLSDDNAHTAENRDVALNCTVSSAKTRPNLTFAENYLGPMPDHPSKGFVTDLALRVDTVIKGEFKHPEIKIANAQSSAKQSGIPVATGDRVILGFDIGLFGRQSRYVLVLLPPQ